MYRFNFLLIFIFCISSFKLAISQEEKYISGIDLFNQGKELLSNNDTVKAIEIFRKINQNDTVFNDVQLKLSSIYFSQGKTDEIIEISNKYSDSLSWSYFSFQLNKGVALMRKSEYTDALALFEKLEKKYSWSYLIQYNLGVIYEYQKEYERAKDCYTKCILLDPFYNYPHLKMGILYYNEGKMTQAMYCFTTYLFLNPQTESANSILSSLNTSVSKPYNETPKDVKVIAQDNSFKECDLVVNSLVSLDNKYKVPAKINYALIRQLYITGNMLETIKSKDLIWEEFYIPFFKEISKKEIFASFAYHISKSSYSPEHQSIIKKNSAKTVATLKTLVNTYKNIASKAYAILINKRNLNVFYYDNGMLYGIGVLDAMNQKQGDWEFYHEDGNLMSKGLYKNNKRDGKWNFYYKNGNLYQTTTFDNGIINDKFYGYHENGNKDYITQVKNDARNGSFTKYYKFNTVAEESNYKNNVSVGKITTYYDMGIGFPHYKFNYNNEGQIHDSLVEYFKSGKVKNRSYYKNGNKEGIEIEYFENGDTNYVLNLVAGKAEGRYREYFSNGQLKLTGNYIKGNRVGKFKEYYMNGKLDSEYEYNPDGKLTGSYKSYDTDGKIFLDFMYQNDKLIEYTFFDKDGKVFKTAQKKQGQFMYEGFYPYMVKKMEGKYLIEGNKDGEWKYYSKYGILAQVETYKNGLILNQTEYFPNGGISNSSVYVNEKQNCYYKEYYENKQLKKEGWIIDGNLQDSWKIYYPDGTLKEDLYYLNDELEGIQYTYTADGYLYSISKYQDGYQLNCDYYNQKKEKINSIDFFKDTIAKQYYETGEVKSIISYKNGYAHGKCTWYYANGKIQISGEYFAGNEVGEWIWFTDKGVIRDRGRYENGYKHGEWKHFTDEGKLKESINYFMGETHGVRVEINPETGTKIFSGQYEYGKRNGPSYFYSEKGELQIVRYFINGVLTSYSYEDKNGELVKPIILTGADWDIKAYYKNGQISRQYKVKNGELNGEYVVYFSNGKIAEKEYYEFGVSENETIYYWENGNIKRISHYKNDHLHGTYKEFYANGKVKEEAEYLNGDRVGKQSFYDNTGKKIKENIIFNDTSVKTVYF